MSGKVKIYKPKLQKTKKSDDAPEKLPKIEEELPEVTVIEKYEPETIKFDSKEEFIQYLADNKEKMDEMTTVKLNKTYKVDGYRITKLKGKISLWSIPKPLSPQDEIITKLNLIISLLADDIDPCPTSFEVEN